MGSIVQYALYTKFKDTVFLQKNKIYLCGSPAKDIGAMLQSTSRYYIGTDAETGESCREQHRL